MDRMQDVQQRETRKFHSFLNKVTATDFQRFWEQSRDPDEGDHNAG
jgi:hypothetical protein